ncbi:hypothetical protein NC651_025966 [Populus alba x Populus x berolinensis]|nr:hypothetical protein NC651_025966 [Populus alba x Populus x berolinensis]
MIEEGYVPDASSVLHDVEDSEKMKMLNHHSEKLAIAFGLLFIPHGLPIRVVKNLRVCGDCHNATKYISKISQREILMEHVHVEISGDMLLLQFKALPTTKSFEELHTPIEEHNTTPISRPEILIK